MDVIFYVWLELQYHGLPAVSDVGNYKVGIPVVNDACSHIFPLYSVHISYRAASRVRHSYLLKAKISEG